MSKALEDIIAERISQRARGFRDDHDDAHSKGELGSAAINREDFSMLPMRYHAIQRGERDFAFYEMKTMVGDVGFEPTTR